MVEKPLGSLVVGVAPCVAALEEGNHIELPLLSTKRDFLAT